MGSKKQKEKQARKQRRQRYAVAQAVHRAVCEYTGGDGLGRCILYAVCGAVLASRVTGRAYIPQAGSLYLHADPGMGPDGWVGWEVHHAGLFSGEFHCWCAGPMDERTAEGLMAPPEHVEMVDLSSRHYLRMVEGMRLVKENVKLGDDGHTAAFLHVLSDERRSWTQEEPPEYLWGNPAEMPAWVKFVSDREATESILGRMEEFRGAVSLAYRMLEE